MASIFTKIINGDIPSRTVWSDSQCVAFLDVRPISPGHTLVVPRTATDHWTDLPLSDAAHLMKVAHTIGVAQKRVFAPDRIGLMIAGFEIPHTHIHVFPANAMSDFDFAKSDASPNPKALDEYQIRLQTELIALGHAEETQAP